ncbi:Tim17/Tim22/Tim23/Pmp24 family-domain-containing protein [Scheffersomyces coipomensis]|uniref:Tim17/Tim22/Tim23/Pmp24 family-domain-containing protein n=1 Tax=Scheffersomyces coipomensis TaxID=1788519 RepID=UPI00315C9096
MSMSWLFGSSSSASSTTPASTSSTNDNNNNDSLKQSLGFDPAQVTDVSNILKTPGLFDSARLHPLAGLDKGIEYLDLEDEQLNNVEGSQGIIPSRSWSDDLCYGTGAVYLLGLGFGGLYGAQEGFKNIPKGAPAKLQLNTILNHITKRGPFLGNSSGVIAMTYNIIDSTLDAIRGKHDDFNSLGAGALAGALFRSSAGIKPMFISSVLATGAAGIWCGAKRYLQY